jgi:hypothetical protein
MHVIVAAAKRSGVHDGSITSVPDSCRLDSAIAGEATRRKPRSRLSGRRV